MAGGVGQFSERGGGVDAHARLRRSSSRARTHERARAGGLRAGKPGAAAAQVGDHSVVMGRRKADRQAEKGKRARARRPDKRRRIDWPRDTTVGSARLKGSSNFAAAVAAAAATATDNNLAAVAVVVVSVEVKIVS